MVPADTSSEGNAPPLETREEVLSRYRHLRAISRQHYSELLKRVPYESMLHQARRLGLAQGKALNLDDAPHMNLVLDLAQHTAEPGRSRLIDRYARSAAFPAGSDEALVLAALQYAQFALIRIESRHPCCGLVATDLIRNETIWLVDENLEVSIPDGWTVVTRLYTPARFSMTAGVLVPVGRDVMEEIIADVPQLRRKTMHQAIDDRRFAEACYRVALAKGILAHIRYSDTGPTAA